MVTISLPQVKAKTKATGFVLYQGPSRFNGKPIAAIVTGLRGHSDNAKTGDMAQLWIISTETYPTNANKCGLDASVCSSCKHRHFRSCYVNMAHGPNAVYRSWKNGIYPHLPLFKQSSLDLFKNRAIRLGAYGDPAALPLDVLKQITSVCAVHTGYTHQWKRCDIAYRDYCMASCDTLEEAKDAIARGWRPFLVRQEGEPLPPGFFKCPASKEAGRKLTCLECGACKGGAFKQGRSNPCIVAHGVSWKVAYYKRGMELLRLKKKIVGVFFKKKGEVYSCAKS